MEPCSSGHEEVCFVAARHVRCPVCTAYGEKDQAVQELEATVRDLEKQLAEAETPPG